MRVVVCVKQVYDPKTVKISRSREELDLREAELITNPADRYALEAALRLAEALGGEVIALTVGQPESEDAVREAIAFGADRGLLVDAEGGGDAPRLAGSVVTRLVQAAVEHIGGVDLVLTGELGGMNGTGGLAPRLAAGLGWPVLLDVVRFDADESGITAVIACDEAAELAALPLPAVAAVGAGPVQPRYPHPARIANAWNPGLLETLKPGELGVEPESLEPDVEPGGLFLGPERQRGQVIGGQPRDAARELVGVLRGKRLI
jgi:electron transfer flavoprotein beta subunit